MGQFQLHGSCDYSSDIHVVWALLCQSELTTTLVCCVSLNAPIHFQV